MAINIERESFSEADMRQFWAKVRRGPGCWEWLGGRSRSQGHEYGNWHRSSGVLKAHRVAYVLQVGAIPEGLTVDHLCRNKLCVRPDHLELVTQSENTLRQFRSPDRLYSLTCPHGHPREFGRRGCRQCLVVRVARSQEKRPEYYREMKRLQKQKERARKRASA